LLEQLVGDGLEALFFCCGASGIVARSAGAHRGCP